MTNKMQIVILPELGEDIEQGIIVNILVSAQQEITAGQTLFEVETDKVVVSIPADQAGRIAQVLVEIGQTVEPGDELLELLTYDAEQPVRVGDADHPLLSEAGSAHSELVEQKNTTNAPPDLSDARMPQPVTQTVAEDSGVVGIATSLLPTSVAPPEDIVAAGPSARRLARELGVDIHTIRGSGKRGRISKDDVKDFARSRLRPVLSDDSVGATSAEPGPTANLLTHPAISDTGRINNTTAYGPVHRVAMTGIQRATARNMKRSWQMIPHAWLSEQIDISELEAMRQKAKHEFKQAGTPLSLTSFLVKALALAMQEFPIFNAQIDEESDEVVYLDYIDIGVAVDTQRGLVVPCLRQVDQHGIGQLARDLAELAEKARENKLALEEMQGAGMTLTNLGIFGLTSIYPVINWPQVAIAGFAGSQTVQARPDKTWEERTLLPMTLAFDHRLINGADAARFIKHVKRTLEQPFRFCLY